MATEKVPLTKAQSEIISEFYKVEPTKVAFNKRERKAIWDNFKRDRTIPALELTQKCPALLSELEKSLSSGKNIQSAVFAECVYAQALADIFALPEFHNFTDSPGCLPENVIKLIASYHLKPRYVYKSKTGDRALVQAGGKEGTDGALITVKDNGVFTIEFKEPASKASEPDLPLYGEDGFLKITPEFQVENPNYVAMLQEQLEKALNFWEVMGTNIHDFSARSIEIAVSENYAAKKYADVICVEDKRGFLTMMPANQVGQWSDTRGEIRPGGRNHLTVWTPNALETAIKRAEGEIVGSLVKIPLKNLSTAKKRGGNDEVNRLKINTIFFVRAEDTKNVDGIVYFETEKVRQIKPTIAAHMFFKELDILRVREHYKSEI